MHLFGADDKLKKYDSPNEIIHDYFGTRYQMYDTRKEYLIKQIESELLILKNKHTYIQDILNGDIDLRRKKKKEIFLLGFLPV